MVKPTFINVGPGRCGTSWLHEALVAHPEIATAKIKETEFFNIHHARGTDWYEDHFPNPGKAVGEISTNYYLDPVVATRIAAYNPDLKIIINLRDPEALLKSFQTFGVRRGIDATALDDLGHPLGPIMGSGYEQRKRAGTLARGDEISLLDAVDLPALAQPYLDAFPREQIFFLVYERIGKEPASLLRELYTFLDVDPDFLPESASEIVNPASQPRSAVLGKLATRASYTLRTIGAHGLLTRLHKSRVLKQLIFKPPNEARFSEPDPAARARLDGIRASMLADHPTLKDHWTASA